MFKTLSFLTVFLFFFSMVIRAEDRIDPAVVQPQNAFALKIFKAVYAQKEKPNIFFAPLDTGSFLRLLIPFTREQLKKELMSFLEMGEMPAEEVPNRSAGLWIISQNTEKEDVDYYSGMSLVGSSSVQFKPDFKSRAAFFKIFPRSYDLTHSGMKTSIDEWLKNNSGLRMWGVTDYFDAQSPMAFVQGFYFKGKWGIPVKPVSAADFQTPAGSVNVSMLEALGPIEYFKEDDFEAVNLRTGTGLFSLFIFMPSSSVKLSDFIGKLTETQLRSWMLGFLERPGRVVFPPFSVSNNLDLRRNLKSEGLESIFQPEAHLSDAAYAPMRVYIGSMEQKAVFETETQPISKPLQVMPEVDGGARHDFFSLKISRPFFFILRNNKTRVWAGLGTVENPQS